MKYAMYTYSDCPHYNIGDSMQLVALENIYHTMGIDIDDVIKISWLELPHYNGEPVVLPVVSGLFSNFDCFSEAKQFSPNITPVYISYVRFNPLTQEDAQYLKEYEPIGCRDEYTFRECGRFGIKAYINGCITASLPKRQCGPKNGKVFIVDGEDEVREFIPDAFASNAVEMSHIIRTENSIDSLKVANEQLEKYKKEASLIITKRLHCALPCAASGIPVILVRNQPTSTLTFVDSLMDIYTQETYKEINWNTDVRDFEWLKALIIDTAIAKLIGKVDKAYKYGMKISRFYLEKNRNLLNYSVNIPFAHIETALKDFNAEFDYSFYGAGNELYTHYMWMHYRYPNARLTRIYDKYKFGQIFDGILIEPIENIALHRNEMCIITVVTKSTREDIKNDLRRIGKPEGSFL